MSIFIVDDSADSRILISTFLNSCGYNNTISLNSAKEIYQYIESAAIPIDLILLDIIMPEIDGIEACSYIKKHDYTRDVPIIIITANLDLDNLQIAFSVGAMDYITKPVNKIELLARVRSALKLKFETDCRKARELELLDIKRQLVDANNILKKLSLLDGLTGIPNRRKFDDFISEEHARNNSPMSLIMLDLDYFKNYNDTYGHLTGDECLKKVARVLVNSLQKPGDLAARYGGEEFVVVLPNTDIIEAEYLAEKIRRNVENEMIEHSNSKTSPYVTVSLGVASKLPRADSTPELLIEEADKALYEAKRTGRNRVHVSAAPNQGV